MNVYDFDNTIYNGDSSIDFYIFCLRKNIKILKYLPRQIKALILHKFKKISKEQEKEIFFEFIKEINLDLMLFEFWKTHYKYIKKWYLNLKKEDDIIISASPEFLLKPICEKLNVYNLIATNLDLNSGKIIDKNCKGENKVKRFYELYHKEEKIENFYSDSLSDEPLARISENAYIVKNTQIEKWPQKEGSKKYLKNFITNLFFILSCIAFIFVTTHAVDNLMINYKITILFSIIVAVLYAIYNNNIIKKFINKRLFNKIISILSSIGIGVFYLYRLYERIPNKLLNHKIVGNYKNILCTLIVLAMLPFCIELFSKIYSYLYDLLIKIWQKSSKINKVVFIIIMIILVSVVLITFLKVQILHYSSELRNDIVYTSDNLGLLNNNAWLNINHQENDLRQPLFAAFSIPFIAPLYIFELIIKTNVPVSIIISNVALIVISAYILSDMVEKENNKLLFFFFYLSTFGPILFLVMLEQYSVAVFWLIIFIYMYINKIEDRNLSMTGAVGTLITTGITFPMLYNKEDRLINRIKKIFQALLYGLFVLILLGRIDVILTLPYKINSLSKFTGKEILFLDRFKQYTHFIVNCIISINGQGTNGVWQLKQLNNINVLGIFILGIVIISFIVNRKDKLNRICFYWIIVSFIILCAIGWGTMENGLILYAMYFSWAIVILIYNLIKKIFKKMKIEMLFNIVIILLTIVMLIYNSYNLIRMLMFLSKI